MERKLVIYTNLYNNYTTIQKSIESLYKNLHIKPYKHFIFDNNYPLNKDQNKVDIKILCEQLNFLYGYNLVYHDFHENKGMSYTFYYFFNKIVPSLNLSDSDVMFFHDSNEIFLSEGFDVDAFKLTENPKNAIITMNYSPGFNTHNLEINEENGVKFFSYDSDFFKNNENTMTGALFHTVGSRRWYESLEEKEPFMYNYSEKYLEFSLCLGEIFKKYDRYRICKMVDHYYDPYSAATEFEDKKYVLYKHYIRNSANGLTFEEFLERNIDSHKISRMRNSKDSYNMFSSHD